MAGTYLPSAAVDAATEHAQEATEEDGTIGPANGAEMRGTRTTITLEQADGHSLRALGSIVFPCPKSTDCR